jgi:glycosyltransferase involved in cell wall biosynthesis
VAGLRIGVNALYMIPGEVGGTEIYLRSLLEALARIDDRNEYFIYVNAETAGEPLVDSPCFRIVPCKVRARIRPWRILWEQTALPLRMKRDRIDVVLNPGFTAPLLTSRPSVTVFHDLQHKRHPEFFRWFDLPFWNLLLWLSVLRSHSLIAVSQATADDLARYYPAAISKTVVIPHGVDPEFFRIGARRRVNGAVSGRYLLTVSTLHPHKNLARLLEAFRVFLDGHPDFRLIIAGLRGFAAERLETYRRDLGLEKSTTLTGWIPRHELYDLYEHATAFVAPSQFEGFGMPILEALAAGLPLACSGIPPFDAIAGGAALRFNPSSVPEIAAAMEFIVNEAEFGARAAIKGPEQARQFDWHRTAALTLEQLELVTTASPRPELYKAAPR